MVLNLKRSDPSLSANLDSELMKMGTLILSWPIGDSLPPPYPMKIAPADARDEIQDNLLIRAETCIFMVKIPRYSTYEVMREKLVYSIFSADDPLSG